MRLYMTIVAIVAVIAGVLLAACSKKAEGVVYTKLDKAGRITNIVLLLVYAALSMSCMGIGLFCSPNYEAGFLRILGWIIAVFVSSVPLFCALSLGLSVSLRKKGKSKAGFAVQFVGLVCIVLALVLFFTCYGSLVNYLS